MAKSMSRPATIAARLGVGKSKFWEDYVLRDPADPYVPNTNRVLRLKPAKLGPNFTLIFDDEADQMIEGLRHERDAGLLSERRRAQPSTEPPKRPRGRPRKMPAANEAAARS
jgi:hypothetical protein